MRLEDVVNIAYTPINALEPDRMQDCSPTHDMEVVPQSIAPSNTCWHKNTHTHTHAPTHSLACARRKRMHCKKLAPSKQRAKRNARQRNTSAYPCFSVHAPTPRGLMQSCHVVSPCPVFHNPRGRMHSQSRTVIPHGWLLFLCVRGPLVSLSFFHWIGRGARRLDQVITKSRRANAEPRGECMAGTRVPSGLEEASVNAESHSAIKTRKRAAGWFRLGFTDRSIHTTAGG